MQKAFIAITLALTLACAFATYTPSGWVKTPVNFLADTDSNFTNTTMFTLGGLTTSDVNVIAYNAAVPVDQANQSNSKWAVWTKTITTKDLSSSANSSYTFNAPLLSAIQYGYAVGLGMGNDSNSIPQIWLYQTKLNGGSALPRVTVTSNTGNFTPMFVGSGVAAWKTMVIFYTVASNKVNFTSVTLGGSTTGKEFTFSSSWNGTATGGSDNIKCDWGEALSSNQVFAAYTEAGVYKVAVVDFSTGTLIGSGQVAGKYDKNMNCNPYVTDKKYYGLLCRNTTNGTVTYFVSSNTTTDLVQLQTGINATTQVFRGMHQYAGYLTIFYTNPSTLNATVISYDTWDVSALTTFVAKKDILTYDPATSGYESYTVPQGGMFGLLYNYNGTVKTSIQVGQVMGASSLTTIFGALMTIVAGLFLF